MTTKIVHHGKCCCGAIRFQAKGDPVIVAHCHCKDCQRISGAGHSTGAMFNIANVDIIGEPAEYVLEADNGNQVAKGFCGKCGSPIFGRNSGSINHITLGLGIFDDSSVFDPEVVIFAKNRKHWDIVDENLPSFDTQPGWNPESDS